MALGCSLCKESLEKLPSEAQNRPGSRATGLSISTTPCGHIFHSYCIQKWLTGNKAGSKQCPCCRKKVSKLLSLHPTTCEDNNNSLLYYCSSPESGGASPCNHSGIIASLNTQINKLSADYEAVQSRYLQEKQNSDTWMNNAKRNEKYAHEHRSSWQDAKRKLKNYTAIHALLGGINSRVEEDLARYPPTPDSIKSLVEAKFVLQTKLRECRCQKLTEKGSAGAQSQQQQATPYRPPSGPSLLAVLDPIRTLDI